MISHDIGLHTDGYSVQSRQVGTTSLSCAYAWRLCEEPRNVIKNYVEVKWPLWSLELPVNRVFAQQFVWADSKVNSTVRVIVPFWGNPLETDGFPLQMEVTRKMFPFDDVIMNVQYPKVEMNLCSSRSWQSKMLKTCSMGYSFNV